MGGKAVFLEGTVYMTKQAPHSSEAERDRVANLVDTGARVCCNMQMAASGEILLGAREQDAIKFEDALRGVIKANVEVLQIRECHQLSFMNLRPVNSDRLHLSGLRTSATITESPR